MTDPPSVRRSEVRRTSDAEKDRSGVKLGQALLEEAALGVRVRQCERALVRRAGLFDAIEPAKQLGARRVQVGVALELQAVDQRERGLGVARLGDRSRLVELDDR